MVTTEKNEPELMSVKEVAAMLGVSQRTVYRMDDAGQIPRSIKLASLVRWRTAELREWIEKGCPKCRPNCGNTN